MPIVERKFSAKAAFGDFCGLSRLDRRPTDEAVDLWTVHISRSKTVASQLVALLSPDEMVRAGQLRFPALRQSFMIVRGVLRVFIGSYLGIDPSSVEFTYGVKGKPHLAPGQGSLQFNISHSGDIALFGFTRDCNIGVDVEQVRPFEKMVDSAARFLHPEETEELLSHPVERRAFAFFQLWTRKEAYVKALGEGMTLPLDGFRVSLRSEAAELLEMVTDIGDTSSVCTLHSVVTFPDTAAAVAYRATPRRLCVFPPIMASELLTTD